MFFTTISRQLITKTVFFLISVGCGFPAFSKEGMWLPATLKNKEADMKKLGLEIPVDQLYNADGTGLNNAVVLFGKGCTGEIISSKGLVLTNHHCGYGTVQGLSSSEKDYFAHGFWAMNNKEEIPCPGLTVTFIRKMENVSANILSAMPDTLVGPGRDTVIDIRCKNLERAYKKLTGYDASIRSFYNGNQYWVILSETFRDIRLVGFPPNGIGQFGGDTDNWMWPRHTGDFSLFRVYADKNNKPADYSADNKPYRTDNFFSINISGYKENDFTMVYGFPGTTQEYISSYQLNQTYSIIDPIRIAVRTKKLDVLKGNANSSREVFLKYTSKIAGIANGWKKWQGEIRGLGMNKVMDKKAAFEKNFQDWAGIDESLPEADGLLARIMANTGVADSAIKTEEYIKEAIYGVEMLSQAAVLDKMLQWLRTHEKSDFARNDSLQKLVKKLDGFYKNYDAATDKDLFVALLPEYIHNNPKATPKSYYRALSDHYNDYQAWANDVFNISLLSNQNKLNQFAVTATVKDTMVILSDPAWQMYAAIEKYRKKHILPVLSLYNDNISYFNRLYMEAIMKKTPAAELYPDANLTLRLTYGQIKGIDPEGVAGYSFQTNLDEAVAKDNPSVAEFTVPQKLKELHNKKDFGRWAVNGTVPLAFTASNHTSGGNSGSPVLNSKGQLIGTNFDRIWEGTMSDFYYDSEVCRNISLDIRYTLFIIEKFGGAGWLLKEMKLVKN